MAYFSGKEIINRGEEWFRKVPSLPVRGRDAIAKATPWLALIIGILGIIGSLVVMGSLPIVLYGFGQATGMIFVSGTLTIISSVMMLVAVPKLLKFKRGGWEILFWAEILSFFASLISGNVLSAIIGTVIVFYLLYQIRSHFS